MRGIANRNQEFELFERTLRANAAKRILLVEGTTERGKSTLLFEFSLLAAERLGARCCACTDFKGGLPLTTLFARFVSELGKDIFANYSKLLGTTSVEVNIAADLSGATLGDSNTVAIQPVINPPTAQTMQRLSEAILQDLHTCAKPIVLIIDTFEHATPEAANWVLQNLLPAVRHNSHLRIVVAGRSVPLPNEHVVTWGRHAEHRVLGPITSVDDWHEFARQLHPAFPRQHIEMLCKGGLPNYPTALHSFIKNVVEQLPPHGTNGVTP